MGPDSDPDHSQNLITYSLSHLGHILKISSKSVHNFLSYLSLKITFHGSRRSGSLPKSNHFFLLPFQTYPEKLKSIHKFLSYLIHKQTDRKTNLGENITSLAEVKISHNIKTQLPLRSSWPTCTTNCLWGQDHSAPFYWKVRKK